MEESPANPMTATTSNLQVAVTEAETAEGVADGGISEQQTLAVCLADGHVEDLPADQQIIIQIVPVDETLDNKATIGVQANDYEIERRGPLPARKRLIPFKFRDYHDPDEVPQEDLNDEDYTPAMEGKSGKSGKQSGRGRGRPKKEHTYGKVMEKPALYKVMEKHASNTEQTVSSEAKAQTEKDDKSTEKEDSGVDCADGTTVVPAVAIVSKRGRPPKGFEKNQIKTFRCLECNKMFTQKGNLKVHMMSHSDERPFACDEVGCLKTFRTKENLRRHKLSHAGIKEFPCSICKEKFASQVSVREHMARHTDTKDYRCSMCGLEFRQISCLRRHQITHSNKKPHSCSVCGARFSQLVYLRSHMRKHTGERPFKCSICEKAFAHLSDLNRHKSVHTGEKKYVCEECGTRFSDPSSRRRHVREHNGFKPYTCQFCGDTFKRSGNLKSHLAKKHVAGSKMGLSKQILVISDTQQPQQVMLQEVTPESVQQQLKSVASAAKPTPQEHSVLNLQTQKILEHIQMELNSMTEAPVDSEGRPLEVAYHIIHDDEDQQIVEIQYHPAVDQQSGDAEQSWIGELPIKARASADLEQPTSMEIMEEVGKEDEDEGTQVDAQADADTNEQPSVHTEAMPDAIKPKGTRVELLKEDTARPISEHFVENTNKQESSQSEIQQTIGDDSVKNDAEEEVESVLIKQELDKEQDSQPQSTAVSSCAAPSSTDFVKNPDFTSQAYYNWLSSFTEVCKIMVLPLDTEIFQKISQVHKTLSDVLAAPTGILTNSGNFRILMDICKELNGIINDHLVHVLEGLKESE